MSAALAFSCVGVQVLLQDKLLKMAKSEKLPPFPVSTNDHKRRSMLNL